MSTGFFINRRVCRIGKKADKSDCAKKDCENCRHWTIQEVWQNCMPCNHQCPDCPIELGLKLQQLPKKWIPD